MIIFICFVLCFIASWAIGQEVKLGALQDTTGATSDVGKDEALGVREATQYYNDKGGVNGKKIRLFQYDYGYRVPEAVTTWDGEPATQRRFLRRSMQIRYPTFPAHFQAISAIPKRLPTTSFMERITQPMLVEQSPTGLKKSGRKIRSGRH